MATMEDVVDEVAHVVSRLELLADGPKAMMPGGGWRVRFTPTTTDGQEIRDPENPPVTVPVVAWVAFVRDGDTSLEPMVVDSDSVVRMARACAWGLDMRTELAVLELLPPERMGPHKDFGKGDDHGEA